MGTSKLWPTTGILYILYSIVFCYRSCILKKKPVCYPRDPSVTCSPNSLGMKFSCSRFAKAKTLTKMRNELSTARPGREVVNMVQSVARRAGPSQKMIKSTPTTVSKIHTCELARKHLPASLYVCVLLYSTARCSVVGLRIYSRRKTYLFVAT